MQTDTIVIKEVPCCASCKYYIAANSVNFNHTCSRFCIPILPYNLCNCYEEDFDAGKV